MLFNWKHRLPLCSVNGGSAKHRAKGAICCLLFNFPSNCQHNKYETHSALNIWTFAQWKLYIILCQKVCCQTLKSLAQAIAKFMCSISSTFASIVMQSCCKHTHSHKHRQLYYFSNDYIYIYISINVTITIHWWSRKSSPDFDLDCDKKDA